MVSATLTSLSAWLTQTSSLLEPGRDQPQSFPSGRRRFDEPNPRLGPAGESLQAAQEGSQRGYQGQCIHRDLPTHSVPFAHLSNILIADLEPWCVRDYHHDRRHRAHRDLAPPSPSLRGQERSVSPHAWCPR